VIFAAGDPKPQSADGNVAKGALSQTARAVTSVDVIAVGADCPYDGP
jgi:hypothetical protein